MARNHVDLRRAVPGDWAPSELAGRTSELLEMLTKDENVGDAAVRAHEQRTLGAARPAPGGQFVALDRIGTLDLDTIVMRRPGLRWRVDIDDQRAILDFGVNSIAGPAVIGPALEYVIQHPSFRVRDLPDPLADESKLVLAGRLIREGFLTIEIQEERS